MKAFYLLYLFLSISTSINRESVYPAIDTLLEPNIENPFSGVILITKDGKTEYAKQYGYADIENERPIQLNDQFVVGSISKQFTAVIVLQEYEAGHIDLSAPIRTYLPQLEQSWADTVTAHHLLTHMHGIVAMNKPTVYAVGTQYAYSQIGYDILARIVEQVSGKSFAQLSADLFHSCGMQGTFHPDFVEGYKDRVKGYEQSNDSLRYAENTFKQYAAAGAFVSTAPDLVLWNQHLWEGKLLKEDTLQLMTTKQNGAVRNHPVFGLTNYGYGITVDDKNGMVQWGQTGYTQGFVSMNFYFPQTKTSVIVLQNTCYDLTKLKSTFKYHDSILRIVRENIKTVSK